jgi:hypothetical protein
MTVAGELVAAAQRSLAVAQGQFASIGQGNWSSVGDMTQEAPYQVADAYNAAMAGALAAFEMAASQAQDAAAFIASTNPAASSLAAQSGSVGAQFAAAYAAAAGCAGQTVLDELGGQWICCKGSSCSWNTQDWYVWPPFLAQCQQVALLAAQLVAFAAAALALPPPPAHRTHVPVRHGTWLGNQWIVTPIKR